MGASVPWMYPKAPRPVLYFIFPCFQSGLCVRYFWLLPTSFPLTMPWWGFILKSCFIRKFPFGFFKKQALVAGPWPAANRFV